jgi:hypothetical protein
MMRILVCAWPSFLYVTLAVANSTITISTVPGTSPERTTSINAYSDIHYDRQDGNVREPLSTITFGQTFGLPPGSEASVYVSRDFHQDGLSTTPTIANTRATSIVPEAATRSTSTHSVVGAAVTITKISIITPQNIHLQSTLTTIITRQTVPVVPVPNAIESGSAQGDETQDITSPAGITQDDPDHPSFQPPVQIVPIEEKPSKWWDSQWVTIATWVLGMYVVGSGMTLGWFWARGCIDTMGTVSEDEDRYQYQILHELLSGMSKLTQFLSSGTIDTDLSLPVLDNMHHPHAQQIIWTRHIRNNGCSSNPDSQSIVFLTSLELARAYQYRYRQKFQS